MLTIDIVSDIVCPWCWIGTRRLASAVDQVRQIHPDFDCQPVWRPFFLNPDTPPTGEPYLPFLERKFGGPEKLADIFGYVRAAARPYGLAFAFETIPLRANTLQAHRLIRWAQQRGSAAGLVERLFVAQFQRAEYVGDRRLLGDIAVECGYPEEEIRSYLAGDADTAVIQAEAADIQARGIHQVPTFLLPDGQVIVGAEDPQVLAAGLLRALAAA